MNSFQYTVVIPSVGRPTLARAIESVLGQSVEASRIIVVGFQLQVESNDEIQYIETESKVSAGEARRIGTECVTTEYVAYLDDDDYWMPEKMEIQSKSLSKSGDLIILNCRAEVLSNFGKMEWPREIKDANEGICSYLFGEISLLPGKYYYPSTGLLMKTKLAKQVGWRNFPHDDWDFYFRAEEMGALFHMIAEKLVVVDQSLESTSRTSKVDRCFVFLGRHGQNMTRSQQRNFLSGVTLQSALNSKNLSEIKLVASLVLEKGIFHKSTIVVIIRLLNLRKFFRIFKLVK